MLPAPMDEHPTAAIPPRSSLIVPANNSITIIPPTPPHNPNSLFPTASNHRQFLRSHRPHAAPSKYSSFLKVVLV